VTVAKERLALELFADLDVRILFYAACIVTEDLENRTS
jgi:hypothetical protein